MAHSRFIASIALCLAIAAPAHAALVISKAPSSNVACVQAVCTATAADAVLNIGDLKKLLVAGDLAVKSGSAAADIEFDSSLKWTKPTRLTLDAYHGIVFRKGLTVQGTGAVTLTTNDGGSGGDYIFLDKGKIAFWDLASSLIVNGLPYTLVTDIRSLANDIAAHPNRRYALGRFVDAGLDRTYKTSPIPATFNGTFEGLGHAIGHLKIASHDACVGLFSTTGVTAVLRDISLSDVAVAAKDRHATAGTLVGCNGGTVVNASAGGMIFADAGSTAGGLVGTNTGLVENASAVVAVDSFPGSTIGGLVGRNVGSIVNVHAGGDVTVAAFKIRSPTFAGGLVGSNPGTVTASSASGNVQAQAVADLGGLIGYSDGSVSQSSASGNVTGICCAKVGGLVGSGRHIVLSHASGAVSEGGARDGSTFAGGLAGAADTIDQSYASGPVSVGDLRGRTARAGGLVGIVYTSLTNSYAVGSVQGTANDAAGGLVGLGTSFAGPQISSSYSLGQASGAQYLGGAMGQAKAPLDAQAVYWDIDTSGLTAACGTGRKVCQSVTGLSDAQLKSALPAGFDPAVWAQDPAINNGYPYLIDNPPR